MKLTRVEKEVKATHGVVCSLPKEYFGYFGWPTLARMDDGTLVAAASGMRGQHVCPFGRSVICTSYDDGQTWTHPRVVNDSPIDDRDTGLISLGGGKLLLTWFASSLFRTWDTGKPPYAATSDKLDDKFVGSWVRLSDDAGASWGDPIRVSVSAPHGPAMLKNGDLLYLGKDFSGDMDYFTRADGPIAALRSSDGGKTWTRQGTVPMCAGTVDANYCEPHVVELNDGRLLGMIRMEGGDAEILPERVTSPGFSLMQTISEDGGKTWTEAYPLGFAGSPPHLMLHSSGAVVCAYGYRSEPCSERAMISRDGGKSWDYDYILNYAPDWDLGYPSSVEMPDGSIFTMYYQKVKDENEKCGLMWTRWQLPE